jgi:hypothetical protein
MSWDSEESLSAPEVVFAYRRSIYRSPCCEAKLPGFTLFDNGQGFVSSVSVPDWAFSPIVSDVPGLLAPGRSGRQSDLLLIRSLSES